MADIAGEVNENNSNGVIGTDKVLKVNGDMNGSYCDNIESMDIDPDSSAKKAIISSSKSSNEDSDVPTREVPQSNNGLKGNGADNDSSSQINNCTDRLENNHVDNVHENDVEMGDDSKESESEVDSSKLSVNPPESSEIESKPVEQAASDILDSASKEDFNDTELNEKVVKNVEDDKEVENSTEIEENQVENESEKVDAFESKAESTAETEVKPAETNVKVVEEDEVSVEKVEDSEKEEVIEGESKDETKSDDALDKKAESEESNDLNSTTASEKEANELSGSEAPADCTPEKTKKYKKSSAPVSPVTPRRSSRNLNKQKSYSDNDKDIDKLIKEGVSPSLTIKPVRAKVDDDEIEEIIPVDPLGGDSVSVSSPKLKNKTIVVNDTKRLAEIAGSKHLKTNKKEPTLVIIDTNAILSGRGPVPIATSSPTTHVNIPSSRSQGFSMLPVALPAQGMYPSIRAASAQVIPKPVVLTPPPKPPAILPTLTDDMFVVEAPSFIVPYVYEKPPVKPLKSYLCKIEQALKKDEEKKQKEEEEKEKKIKEAEEEKEKEAKEVVANQSESNDKEVVKNSTEGVKEQEPQVEKMEVDDPDAEKAEKSGAATVKTDVKPEEAVKADDKKEEEKKDSEKREDDKKEDDKKEDEKKEAEIKEDKKEEVKKEEVKKEDVKEAEKKEPEKKEDELDKSKKPSNSYFDAPLGKFFMQIGINLVQEHVQTDLLRSQKKKLDKEGAKCSADTQLAIDSLSKTLEFSKENNDPFKLPQKKCEYCSFKTESALVMAHHLETPHMKNYVYRCNFCPLEVRSPHDILYHMEAEHNIRGRLERAPAFHQCPSCPFEDNQKGKLTRHLISCVKKYRPERNQEPPLDWEPPAKIPRVTKNRPSAMSPGNAVYQAAMSGLKQGGPAHHPLLPKLATAPPPPNQTLMNRGRGRPQAPSSIMQRFQSPQAKGALNQPLRAGMIYRPSGSNAQPQVLLPTSYQISGNQIFQNMSGQKNIVQSQGLATAKLLNQPSISITPLPRQGAAPSTPSPTQQIKPGRPPSATGKAQFVICEICDGYIKDLEQLRNHMQWIHKVKIHPKMIYNRPPLNCQKCQFRFFTDQGLERHLLGSHGLVTSSMQEAANKGKDGGRCPVCGRVYQWKLLNHVARDHSMSLKPAHLSYKCTVCTATFGMYKQFESHVYSAHSVVAKRVMDKKVSSPQPSTSSSSQSETLLKPLKINDEITIIPQPARAMKPSSTASSSKAASNRPMAKKV